MPTFAYRAVDLEGRRTRGRLSASSESAAVRDLETRGLVTLDLRQAEKRAAASTGLGRRKAVLEFTRGMAALLPAGMPLSRALQVSAETSPERIRPALDRVRDQVQRGEPLAAALGGHPALFSSLYVGIVQAGERTGSLDAAFSRLASHLEREDELRSKLVSMSIYPVVLAVVGIASVLVLLLFVLPRFADLLEGTGSALPRSTALVLSVASAASANWFLFLLLPPVALAVWAWVRKSDAGRRWSARFLTSLPVVGAWRRQALAARFARMTGELLAGGSPVLSALRDAGGNMSDPVAREGVDRVRSRVREGSQLHLALREVALFPPALAQLVELGEEAGRMADFLLKAAELLERRTEQALQRMVALAEPTVIVLFGGVVALVALSLLQAIYGMNPGTLR